MPRRCEPGCCCDRRSSGTSLAIAPPIMKGLRRGFGKVPGGSPGPQRVENRALDEGVEFLAERGEAHADEESPRPQHQLAKAEPHQPLSPALLAGNGVAAV